MPNTRKQTPRRLNITFIVAVAALLLAAVGVVLTLEFHNDQMLMDKSNAEGALSEWHENARYEFCYDNNVHPCDDIAIKEFNAKPENKDNQFYLGQ